MDIFETLYEEGFEEQAGILKKMAKNSIRLVAVKSDEAVFSAGESKIGGLPHLPAASEWPSTDGKPLLFIAQINLEQTAVYDTEKFLPDRGMLYFFHNGKGWGYDPDHKNEFRVIYHAEISSQLLIARPPGGLPKQFAPCKITFRNEASYPGCSILLDRKTEFFDGSADKEDIDLFYDIVFDKLRPDGPVNKLFGFPDLVQDWGEYNDIFLESQLVTNGIYCGETDSYKSPQAQPLKAGAKDWILLLQIDSDENPRMSWYDDGRIYFTIRKNDLADLDFGAAWACIQCD